MRIESEHVVSDDGLDFMINTYRARDGKPLSSLAQCIKYEKKLDATDSISHLPFRQSSIMQFSDWYYISSVADFYALRDYIEIAVQGSARTDFECFDFKNKLINDWVSFNIERHYDGNADICYFKSFKSIKEDLLKLQSDFMALEQALSKGRGEL